MKILLDKLAISIKHLNIIDEIFFSFNHPQQEEYLKIRNKIEKIDKKWSSISISPSEQLYIGGKKANQYSRTMILSDIVEYIITGRLYYFFLMNKDDPNYYEKKRDFFKIIFLVLNQLMIWDSLTVEKGLRDYILNTLKNKVPQEYFFKDEVQKKLHQQLSKISEDIGFKTIIKDLPSIGGDSNLRNKLSEYYDSLLPKTAQGLWNEIITYLYMLKTNIGYVLPLLLTQRIYSIDKVLKPPDFIVIDYDNTISSIHINNEEITDNLHEQKLIGVEVGGGKELQSGTFSGETKQPAITVRSENIPPRCPVCGKWILFCEKVIEDFSDINNPLTYCKDHIKCLYSCDIYSPEEVYGGKCPNVQYNGKIDQKSKEKLKTVISFKTNYHYHYSCIKQIEDEKGLLMIEKAWKQYKNEIKKQPERIKINPKGKFNAFVSNYPYIRGIEVLEMYNNKSKMICFGQQDKIKDVRNCLFGYCNFYETCSIMTKFISEQIKNKEFESIQKTLDEFPL
ncbi:MAG: hypothetical protein V3V33_10185 [Candidatus Lokiarchaeia archaeon]